MVELTFDEAYATESGDYFQLHFGNDDSSTSDSQLYFLIQRSFEDDKDTSYYIETNAEEMINHYDITQATLSKNYLYLNTTNSKYTEFKIVFKSTQRSFNQVERIFRVMFKGIPS